MKFKEYCDYNGGAGVQHIALRSNNIIQSIQDMRARGLEFMKAPAAYYETLKEKLKGSKVKILEDLDVVKQKSKIY